MRIQGIKSLYKARGYVIEKIAIKGDQKTVTLKRDKRFGKSCPFCLSERTRLKEISTQSARDYPIGDAVFTTIHYPAVQIYCIPCGQYRTIRPALMDEQARVTRRYMEYVSRLCRKTPASEVAELLGHSPTTVCDWDKRVLQRKLPKPNLNRLRILLVDEKSVRRGHKYVTVVMNGDTHEVLFLEEGHKKETLMRFIDKLNTAQKSRIQAVGIDRGGAYLSAVREALPEAAVVFDKFHIIQNMNAAMDEIRRSEYKKALKEKSATASLIKGQRYNLFRLAENRTEAQSIRLQELLSANETLSTAHMLCEELRLLWGYRHWGYAERFLRNWVSLVEESGIDDLIRFARSIWRSKAEILNYIQYQVTTGPLESLNNIIEQILRRSCGMRDIEYLYLKVRQVSLDL